MHEELKTSKVWKLQTSLALGRMHWSKRITYFKQNWTQNIISCKHKKGFLESILMAKCSSPNDWSLQSLWPPCSQSLCLSFLYSTTHSLMLEEQLHFSSNLFSSTPTAGHLPSRSVGRYFCLPRGTFILGAVKWNYIARHCGKIKRKKK